MNEIPYYIIVAEVERLVSKVDRQGLIIEDLQKRLNAQETIIEKLQNKSSHDVIFK